MVSPRASRTLTTFLLGIPVCIEEDVLQSCVIGAVWVVLNSCRSSPSSSYRKRDLCNTELLLVVNARRTKNANYCGARVVPTRPASCAHLKLRTRISACFSTIRPCSLANLAFSHLRVFGGGACLEAADEAALPPSSTPAFLTMLLILMACSAQMPTLSITTGLDGGWGKVRRRLWL